MDRKRMALVAVIAAQWLAIIGSVLLLWGLLGRHLGQLTAGGISLVLAVVAGAFVLSLAGMAAKPIWDVRLSRE